MQVTNQATMSGVRSHSTTLNLSLLVATILVDEEGVYSRCFYLGLLDILGWHKLLHISSAA